MSHFQYLWNRVCGCSWKTGVSYESPLHTLSIFPPHPTSPCMVVLDCYSTVFSHGQCVFQVALNDSFEASFIS